MTTPTAPPPPRDRSADQPPHGPSADLASPDGASRAAVDRAGVRRAAIRAGVVVLALVAAVMLLGLLIRRTPAVGALDLAVSDAANRALAGPAGSVALGIDLVFGSSAACVLTVLAALVAGLLRRSLLVGARLAVLIAVPWGSVAVIKLVVRRPRPDLESLPHQLLGEPSSFSYPSGHTAFAAAFCLAILCTLPPAARRVGVGVGIAVAVLVVLTTAWSRVALGMHYPTDVLAAMLLVVPMSLLLARTITMSTPARVIRDRIVA